MQIVDKLNLLIGTSSYTTLLDTSNSQPHQSLSHSPFAFRKFTKVIAQVFVCSHDSKEMEHFSYHKCWASY